jgi:peptidoglycan/LPS O-acetylase OafA/YrhL
VFRGDIQGLRAVAVLLVALDHAAIEPFHGGFVGVDVFFVISGFLITSLLLTEAVREGRISLIGFYARRARRILPAATVVTLATIAASVFFLSGVDALGAIEDAVWATFFAANIKFASDGTDYFQNEAAPSPLQHYWSLAVEEQFYLVWPLLVLMLCLLVRRAHRRRHRPDRGRHAARPTGPPVPGAGVIGAAVALLTVVVVASFAWSVVDTRHDAVPAYFSPFTRAWELGLGALTACLVPALGRIPRRVLGVVSWLGLAGVLVAALTYDPGTLFPGYAAALPVVGTSFLLAGGLAPAPWGPQRLLTLSPWRAVGDWSYSFYLWHWPALIIAGALWGPVSGWSGVAVLAGALALSAVSYQLVENPVRRMRILSARPARGLVLYPAVVVLMLPLMAGAQTVVEKINTTTGAWITTSSFGRHHGDPKPHFSRDPDVALVEASVLAARNDAEIPRGLSPAPLAADQRKPDVGDCEYYPGFKDMLCPRGDRSADRTLVLVGDSHARQWIPALDVLAEKYGYKAYYLVRVGCPGADVTPWLKVGGPSTSCERFQDWAVDQVQKLEPAVTIIGSESSSNRGYVDDHGDLVDDPDETRAMFEDGMERSVTRLGAHSGRVIYIGDPPATDFQTSVCLSKRGASLRGCMAARDPRSLEMTAAARAGALRAGADYVDPTKWFCVDDSCPAVIGHFVPRRDLAHITVEYAQHLASALDRELGLRQGAAQSPADR